MVAEQFYLVSANTTKKIQRENSFITLNLPFISYHRRKFLDLSNDFLSIIGLHICMKKPWCIARHATDVAKKGDQNKE